jgi:hypothetical protein
MCRCQNVLAFFIDNVTSERKIPIVKSKNKWRQGEEQNGIAT